MSRKWVCSGPRPTYIEDYKVNLPSARSKTEESLDTIAHEGDIHCISIAPGGNRKTLSAGVDRVINYGWMPRLTL